MNNKVVAEKLTKSPRLNKLLYQMGIFNYYDVINHLPRRYEDLSYTHERDLKDKLLDSVISFLQELGPGFSLVGREYKLVTPTNKNYYIDLLMYHTKIHAYVVIEVKIGEFQPSYIGQLQFYINAIDDLEKMENDNPTIGLLLCKTADSYVVKTTLKTSTAPMGVSKYHLLDDLPNYLIEKMQKI